MKRKIKLFRDGWIESGGLDRVERIAVRCGWSVRVESPSLFVCQSGGGEGGRELMIRLQSTNWPEGVGTPVKPDPHCSH